MDYKNDLWEDFEVTGSIESYMRYKGIIGFEADYKVDDYKNDKNAGFNH